jgi:hypothetical protein
MLNTLFSNYIIRLNYFNYEIKKIYTVLRLKIDDDGKIVHKFINKDKYHNLSFCFSFTKFCNFTFCFPSWSIWFSFLFFDLIVKLLLCWDTDLVFKTLVGVFIACSNDFYLELYILGFNYLYSFLGNYKNLCFFDLQFCIFKICWLIAFLARLFLYFTL